jgi:capsular polysaccharide biosynthesis protein
MTVWTVVRRHTVLLLVGGVTGAVLALLTIFQIGSSAGGLPTLVLRPLQTYTTGLTAVIDTSAFGLGTSGTDVNQLANLAPTYAELLTSDQVLRRAESLLPGTVTIRRADAVLGSQVDAQASAEAVVGSPIVNLTVEAWNGETATRVAAAVMSAFQDYLVSSQVQNGTPPAKRLAILVMGQPTTPQPASNRLRELAILLLCLPVATAYLIAYRLEKSRAPDAPGADAPVAQAVDRSKTAAAEASE